MPSTIHQVINLPPQGTAMSLGPVKVLNAFAVSETKNGKKYRNLNIEDSSGKCKMTLWGASADLPINVGGEATFLGTIKRNEYQGTVSIATEDAHLVGVDGPIAPITPETKPSSSPSLVNAAQLEPPLSMLELAKQVAQFTAELQHQLAEQGLDKEVINAILKNSAEIPSLWGFGTRRLVITAEGSTSAKFD